MILTHARRLAALLAIFAATTTLHAQAPDQAEQIITSARRAYNEKNYPFAAARFTEYLQKFNGQPQTQAARYGLALCYLEGPERDYLKAIENLNPPANDGNFPDRPFALYYLGLANRGEGVKQANIAAGKTPEAGPAKEKARQRFEEAARWFGEGSNAFLKLVKDEPKEDKLPVELEWTARCKCDQAEAFIRLNKLKEAQDATAPFIAGKSPLQKSKYRQQGLYYHGMASFLLKDNLTAGKSLSLLAPFSDPVFGSHARYLLGRIHHAEQERPEAIAAYEGAIAAYAAQKKSAQEALRQPDRFKNDPEERVRLETLIREVPEHIGRATFFLAVMQYEDGKFADAQARFSEFAKQFPNSPIVGEAQLREGFCQVQLKAFPEATKTLNVVAEKYPTLQDQAWFWLGRAQVQASEGAPNPQAQQAALKAGQDLLRKAADRAGQLAQGNPPDPEAKVRRAEILADLADTFQTTKQHKEAADVYKQLLAENLLPARREEFTLSQATALHLAGDYNGSDALCSQFTQQFPGSVFLPAIAFRQAENAYFNMLAVEKLPASPERQANQTKWLDESIKRYSVVVEKYPEFAQVSLARYGLGACLYKKGDLEKAQTVLAAIPPADRTGDLKLVPYQLADILVRTAPANADDAVSAGKLEEVLKEASELLDSFIAANPNAPQTPDALLKLGLCQQRIATVLTMPEARNQAITKARAAYDTISQKFGKSEQAPQAQLEKAKVKALANDIGGAINDLRAFGNDPLRFTKVAPLATVNLAILLRKQNQAQQGADALAVYRRDHEENLKKDPATAPFVPLLMYHHGVCLREANKPAEARAILNALLQQFPASPEAPEAALRSGQCAKEEAQKKLTEAQQQLQASGNPQQREAAQKKLDDSIKEMRDAIGFLENSAQKLAQAQPMNATRARLNYEAAWAHRTLATLEINATRARMQQELIQKRRDEIAKTLPPGTQVPPIPTPEIPLKNIPVQPGEQGARAQYQALIDAFPDVNINVDARFELAELLGDRGDHDAAIKLLKDALDKEPAPEMTDRLKVRLAQSLMLKNDLPGALAAAETVASNPKSPVYPQGLYRAAECLFQMGKTDEAIQRLVPFRDQGPLQNVPGVSDRALLRLGQALTKKQQWDPSRQAFEILTQRFPQSSWVPEAFYGIGWAQQNANQFDPAVNAYNEVTKRTGSELAAKSQVNIGLCRLSQKRYGDAATALLVVPYTYDYPNLSAVALLEAARALVEDKKPEQAIKLLERLLRDHPDSEAAGPARTRLAELKKN
jgi:TolA-binding protein